MMNPCENLECARTPVEIAGTFLETWLSLLLILASVVLR